MTDWNEGIIDEFRANQGLVGGVFEGKPLLILHHTGARSGSARQSPLMYQPLDSGFAVFASKAGADSHPSWFHNVVATPDVRIEVGTDSLDVRARVANGAEHERIWEKQKRDHTQFAEYEARTDRVIPVVVLEPR